MIDLYFDINENDAEDDKCVAIVTSDRIFLCPGYELSDIVFCEKEIWESDMSKKRLRDFVKSWDYQEIKR